MQNELKYTICGCCGSRVINGRFCTECGSPLGAQKSGLMGADNILSAYSSAGLAVAGIPAGGAPGQTVARQSQGRALSDTGLTLLVNTCKKTVATVGGDGYSEIVLYLDEKTGEYQLHTYSKYVYMQEEAHSSFAVTSALAKQVFDYIEENGLAEWRNIRGFGLCGGDYIIRFRYGEEIIRLGSENMTDSFKAYHYISNLLFSQATEENRRYADDVPDGTVAKP